MTPDFCNALEGILRRTSRRLVAKEPNAPPATKRPATATEQRRQWFSNLAATTIMPLLEQAAESARKYGADASTRLGEVNDHLTAELVMVRGSLPKGARPPRLTVYATDDHTPLMIEYTGTFPHVGATGGFGAEIDFDPIYPAQLEKKVVDFVELACGGGS